jgi:hypothetical protein
MDLIEQIKSGSDYSEKNSYNWFLRNVTAVARQEKVKSMDILTQNQPYLTNRILPGKMYSFFYSAKNKDTLPYWDAMPLILPFSMTATHFTALNLHYLPPKQRLLLLNNLMKFANNRANDEKAKLKLSWNLLSNASKFPQVGPCVKQYIKSHVKSKFVELPMSSWHIMAFMPIARFKGASEAAVQDISKRIIGK